MTSLPFLTLPDPKVSGEGALDPLGLAAIGEQLANRILPGLRARMSRPRFLTAMAVSAAVCEGLEHRFAADGTTPAYLVFEWLMVEALVRAGTPEATRSTPGSQKVNDARTTGERVCARTYLKTPTVFGFHGVYKPLARHLRIVDDNLCLADSGYELLKVWQTEQRLAGFLETSGAGGAGSSLRRTLRSALEESLAAGYTNRGAQWQGWSLLARHLAPSDAGRDEARFLDRLLTDPESAPRGEIFQLLRGKQDDTWASDGRIAQAFLFPAASRDLSVPLRAIAAYEGSCAAIEESFEWIRYLSTHSVARPITVETFGREPRVQALARGLAAKLKAAEDAVLEVSLAVSQQFTQVAKSFDSVTDAATLFEALLVRHAEVQTAKPPDGKRAWFERSPKGDTLVRPPYRMTERPNAQREWGRPYRISSVCAFLDDLRVSAHGQG